MNIKDSDGPSEERQPTWWKRWHNHIYGFASLIGLFLALVAFWPRPKPIEVVNTEPLILPQPCKDKYIVQPYTTGPPADNRISKVFSCPEGMVVTLGSALCKTTADAKLISSTQVNENTWRCVWEYVSPGIGMWIEMNCECKE